MKGSSDTICRYILCNRLFEAHIQYCKVVLLTPLSRHQRRGYKEVTLRLSIPTLRLNYREAINRHMPTLIPAFLQEQP